MAELKTDIPDELDRRLKSYLDAHNGEDLASLTARALDGALSFDEDPLLQAELIRKTRQGFADVDAGRVADSLQATREIAAEKELKFKR